MKFTVQSTILQKALSKISGVVPTKSTLPILEHILFMLSKNKLRLLATDLEIAMFAELEVNGTEDGSIAVPARRLMDTIKALPDVTLVFSVDENSKKIKIITESGEYNSIGESPEEYPTVPEFKSEKEISLPPQILSGMIHKTLFSVSTDELRPAMTGLLLQIRDQELCAVATDGHRLVRVIYTNINDAHEQKDIIIPAKALQLVAKAIDPEMNTLSVSTTHVKFTFGNFTLISRLIDESYPNYETVIPLDNDKKLIVSREALLSSVRRVSLYSNAATHQIRFSLKENELKVTAEDADFGGEAKERIPCMYTHQELEIGFNWKYIEDVLTHIDTESVEFHFSTPVRAAIITPAEQKTNESILMLVMPMRLNA
ncbi:MAG: DNA polymerase III subunit beta [Bacteroidetes bacterium]|nr:DNA polymerase III subunit beta [Bacteroidota bacterium]